MQPAANSQLQVGIRQQPAARSTQPAARSHRPWKSGRRQEGAAQKCYEFLAKTAFPRSKAQFLLGIARVFGARGSSSAIAPCSRTAGFSSVPDGRLSSKPRRAGAGAVRDDPRRAPVGRLHGHQDLRASWRGRLLAGHVQLRTCCSACRDSFGEFPPNYILL